MSEKGQIHIKSDVFAAVAVFDAEAPYEYSLDTT